MTELMTKNCIFKDLIKRYLVKLYGLKGLRKILFLDYPRIQEKKLVDDFPKLFRDIRKPDMENVDQIVNSATVRMDKNWKIVCMIAGN